MRSKVSRRGFLATAAAALTAGAGPVWSGAPAVSLRPKARPGAGPVGRSVPGAEALIARAKLGDARVGFSVMDVRTGLLLEEHGARVPLPPASVTKAVTALYALQTLGAGHRFETRLIATGPVSDGVLAGDLILAGGGDPTLDTDALAEMTARLKAAGVRRVAGRVRVHDAVLPYTRVIDADQPDHVSYNPAISGLNLNHNRVHFEWKRNGEGYAVTIDARTVHHRPSVRVARMRIAQREQPVYTYRDGGDHDSWTVAYSALGKGGARWLPVRRPAEYAGEVFAAVARAQGIALGPPQRTTAPPRGAVLVTWRSKPLRDILRDMLKYSNNMMAEVVGMSATAARRGRPASLRESAAEMSRWGRDGLGMTGTKLIDHSGLGDASRMPAQAMTQALVRVRRDGVLGPILKEIRLRDAKGRESAAHPIKVRAKTGTLNFVSTLAGYMTAPDGTELAFAIFAADTGRRARIKRAERERPPGASGWNRRAKTLQQALIERWGAVYGS